MGELINFRKIDHSQEALQEVMSAAPDEVVIFYIKDGNIFVVDSSYKSVTFVIGALQRCINHLLNL